jgi:hypothetical protein
MREESDTRTVPVVLVSSDGFLEPLSEQIMPPVVNCFHKPIPLAGLLEIAALLENGRSGGAPK